MRPASAVRRQTRRSDAKRAVPRDAQTRQPTSIEALEDHQQGLVDVHCHILPSLDDGALDLADSLAMARQAADDGIAVVCATPHIRDDHDVRIEELPARVAELQAAIDGEGVPVHIELGAEVSQRAAEASEASALHGLALGGRSWVLLEPAPGPLGRDLLRLAQRLRADGLGVLIAHPERHAAEGFAGMLHDLVEAGCLIQWTAAFVASAEHGEVALELAREGLLHLLGSDAHSSHGGRPVRLRAAIDRLRSVCSAERVSWIAYEAPAAVLRGEPLTPLW